MVAGGKFTDYRQKWPEMLVAGKLFSDYHHSERP